MKMRVWLIGVLACTVAMAAAQQRSAPAIGGQFQINGIVVNATNNQPLAGAYVTINAAQGLAARTVTTGADGAFRFTGVRAGKYQLSAEHRGFASQSYQQHEGRFSTAIVAGPDQDTSNIVFRVLPDASFSGRVGDEQGDAVRNARVMLIHDQEAEGRTIKAIVGNVATDDLGRYHFAHLRPGAYYLAVSARPWYAQAPGPRGGIVAERNIDVADDSALDVAYPLTFYPDVTDSAAASAIRLEAGDRASADFTLRVVSALHVRIRKGNASEEENRPQDGTATTLTQLIFDGIEVPVQSNSSFMRGNQSVVSGIPPGHYLLSIAPNRPNGRRFPRRAQQTPSDEQEQPEHEQVARVREVDLVSDTELDASEMAATAAVSGTVKLGNGQAPAKPVSIGLRRGATRRTFGARTNASGEFTLPQGLAAGTYDIFMSSGDDLFIHSVRAIGARVAGRTLRISGGDAVKLSIVVNQGAGKIEGVAQRDGKPQAGAMILLVPQDMENNLPLVRRDQSDSDGSFTLAPVLAGRYTLLALENGWNLQWSDASALKPFLANGESVVVEPKGNYTAKLKVQ